MTNVDKQIKNIVRDTFMDGFMNHPEYQKEKVKQIKSLIAQVVEEQKKEIMQQIMQMKRLDNIDRCLAKRKGQDWLDEDCRCDIVMKLTILKELK